MTKLGRRMREHGASSVHHWEDWATTAEALLNEGADEIERLQEALNLAVSRGCDHCAESIRAARQQATPPSPTQSTSKEARE
jgi:hypothetical protein